MLVDSAIIANCSLHRHLDRRLHPYILPYGVLYPVWYYVYTYRYEQYLGSEEWTFLSLVVLLSTQALIWLSAYWNIEARAITRYTKAGALQDAQAIKIVPGSNQGSGDICDLTFKKYSGQEVEISFTFQKKKFIYNSDRKVFKEVQYPVDNRPQLIEFQKTHGLTNEQSLIDVERQYGMNRFDIPIPSFAELFKEHAVAPFFVFQIFCVGLWCLDEYWYYSLFTGFMLIAFECTVVFQRQKTLNEFRTMSIKPYQLQVYRLAKWTWVESSAIFPGDLISVVRTKEDSGVPCDALLIHGNCIVNEAMLTGESTPLLKESIALRSSVERIDLEGVDRNALLSSGTKILQVTPSQTPSSSDISNPPDGGVIAVVLRTGFETQQGSLVRTMIYSTERVSANNLEALLFILFLLVFAIAASWYVWTKGVLQDRPRKKLLLDCILIITSVVPPELPMELSLAVNSSLAALSKHAIFCTEPFRIPFAGRVDICCFDKTGTLTEEDLVVEGLGGLSSADVMSLQPMTAIPTATILVLASAHSVVLLEDGTTVGDPMERATLQSIRWNVGANETVLPPAEISMNKTVVTILRRFQFSSALKRQSTIARITDATSPRKKTLVSVKGAPETIRSMLSEIPAEYDQTYKQFTRNGSRVIALGYRYLEDNMPMNKVNKAARTDVECGLEFAGFLIFGCPLKPDAKKTIIELNESSHRVIMITGDNPLTACHVARDVEIIDREVLILDANSGESESDLVLRNIDESLSIGVDATKPLDYEILQKYDLCITGVALSKLVGQVGLHSVLQHAWVYARVSPGQKEFILTHLKDSGFTTLMCGDGTNDVGALKQAHIGVALLNGSEEDLQKIAEHAKTTRLKAMYEKQTEMLARWNRPAPPCPPTIAHLYPPGPHNPHRKRMLESMGKTPEEIMIADELAIKQADLFSAQQLAQQSAGTPQTATAGQAMLDNMMSQIGELDDDEGPPTIKLGDASCAAPFTSKLAHVGAIAKILRQGRCTLVATIQMYKILALNCLISAYSLSVLYLDGIKFGDGQVTISGMLMSVCFLCISRGKPLERLSKERPHPGIFNVYIIGSILAQFAVHCATLIFISQYIQRTHPKEVKIDLEAKFEPSLLNSGIYLLQLTQQISTFSINYQGRPFRESIRENKYMFYGLSSVAALAFSCSTEFIPEINESLRLVKFSDQFKFVMTTTMVVDYFLCYMFEQVFKFFFADSSPKSIAVRSISQLARETHRLKLHEEEST